MSEEKQTRPRGLGKLYRRPGRESWYIEFWHLGRRYRECAHTTREGTARALLRRRQGELDRRGKITGPRVEATRYEHIEKALLAHYAHGRKQGFGSEDESEPEARRARQSVHGRLAHLKAHFGAMRATDIRYKSIEEYVEKRRRQGAAPSSIRTELAHLRLGLVRAVATDLLDSVPLFPRLEGSAPREGSATPEEIVRLISHLPEYLRPMVTVQYVTGWRGKHLRTLTWGDNVLPGPVLFLPAVAGNKKRAKDVHFDCSEVPWLVALIEMQRQKANELTLMLGRGRNPVAFVFPNNTGEMISENAYNLAWRRARKVADLPKLRSHDCRRSATQNNRQLGIDKRVRMDMVGHKSEAQHDAYDAAARHELRAAARAVGNLLGPAFAMLTDTETDTKSAAGEKAGG